MKKEELLNSIKEAVVDMDEELTAELCKKSLEEKIEPNITINDGLIVGMNEVSRLYEEEEYFLPEVLMSSEAMNKGLDVINPSLDRSTMEDPIKVVVGVVEGDTHDIGKNLARVMMDASGMEVYDLGRDVPLNKFIDKAEEVGAHVIGMSTLMTTTMDGMKTVIDDLKDKKLRGKYKVLIGGGPISQSFADDIGADIYASDAASAVKIVKSTFGRC